MKTESGLTITTRAKNALVRAEDVARKFNNNFIGLEHLLLGLTHDETCVAMAALKNLGVNVSVTRENIRRYVRFGRQYDDMPIGKISQTPDAQLAMKNAEEEAQRLKCNYLGTEHLLLGILQVDVGFVSAILQTNNIKEEDVLREVKALLGIMGTAQNKLEGINITKTTGLNVMEAVRAAKDGKKIRRASWLPGEAIYHSSDRFRFACDDRLYENFLTYDILADDWEIVPEPPKTMTFQEAVEAMKQGMAITRASNRRFTFRYSTALNNRFVRIERLKPLKEASFYIEDINATDWIIVDETSNQQETNNE